MLINLKINLEAGVMSMIRRIFVEKKDAFAVEAHGLLADLRNNLGMTALKNIRMMNRYDVENIEKDLFDYCFGSWCTRICCGTAARSIRPT